MLLQRNFRNPLTSLCIFLDAQYSLCPSQGLLHLHMCFHIILHPCQGTSLGLYPDRSPQNSGLPCMRFPKVLGTPLIHESPIKWTQELLGS